MTENGSPSNKTLLATMAHPDDETFGVGGTLAFYAQQGVDVHVLCATNGEEGTVSEEDLGTYSSIAELRTEKELRCATDKLGVSGLHLLGYRDSGMYGSTSNDNPDCLNQAPIEEVARRIATTIRQVQPQVVITHDPNGNYFHPDHIAVHRATVRAFEITSDPDIQLDDLPPFKPDKLYFNTWPKRIFQILIRIAPFFGLNPREFGRNKDIDLVEIVGEDSFPIDTVVNYRKVASIKKEATACHQSQLSGGPPAFGVLGMIMRLMGDKDWYTQAYPEKQSKRKEKDLFSGVN